MNDHDAQEKESALYMDNLRRNTDQLHGIRKEEDSALGSSGGETAASSAGVSSTSDSGETPEDQEQPQSSGENQSGETGRYPFQLEDTSSEQEEREEYDDCRTQTMTAAGNGGNSGSGGKGYAEISAEDPDDNNESDEIVMQRSFRNAGNVVLLRRMSHRYSCLALLAVLLLVAGVIIAFFDESIPITTKNNKGNQKNKRIKGEYEKPLNNHVCGNGNNEEGCTPLYDENDDSSILGTCRDPIHDLEEKSSLKGLKNGAVASDHPVCSQMGTSILRDLGGNAVDAAVTTALCLGLASPSSSGVGGGAFMLIHADPVDEDKLRDHSPPFHDARDHTQYIAVNEELPPERSASGKIIEVIDSREVAPQLASRDMFLNANVSKYASTVGGLAIAVPGELKGLELAHVRHGRLPWADVIRPVVKLAREGIAVTPQLAERISIYCSRISGKILEYDPDTAQVPFDDISFLHPLRKFLTKDDNWEHPLEAGDIIRNPALATVLERIMNEGTQQVFSSSGDIAQDLAKDIQAAGGIITAQEIDDYKPTIRSPLLSGDVFGFAVAGTPPCSSGGAAVIGIARFLASMTTPVAAFAETLSAHWFVEACRHVYAIRMSLSDPNFNRETVEEAVHDLIHGDYMRKMFQASDPDTTMETLSKYGGEKWAQLTESPNSVNHKEGEGGYRPLRRNQSKQNSDRRRLYRTFGYLEDHGTSHFSIIDKDGNAVAMTSTINTLFGSSVMSEKTGILLNNQMDDFATPGRTNAYGLAPAESNFIAPGKKPLSSMSPTLVFRVDLDKTHEREKTANKYRTADPPPRVLGPIVLAVGGSGGSRIITAVVQVLMNFVVLGKPLFDAVIQARIHDQLIVGDAAVTAIEKRQLVSGQTIALSNRTRNALLRRNHQLYESDFTGVVQAIGVDLETGSLMAVSDVRKGGAPDGY